MQAIVATPSATLSRHLWSTPYSSSLLRKAHIRSEENGTLPLQLHPILRNLNIEISIDSEGKFVIGAPCTRSRSRKAGKIFEVSDLEGMDSQNATYPPIKSVVSDSRYEHDCLHDTGEFSGDWDFAQHCTYPAYETTRDERALSIVEFVEVFLYSMRGACSTHGDAVFGNPSQFDGWSIQRISPDTEIVHFEEPFWQP